MELEGVHPDVIPKELAELDVINSTTVHALKQLQLNRVRKEIEMQKKYHDLQVEWDKHFQEFDEKRRQIITGEYVPTAEECKYEFADPAFPEPLPPKEKGISDFWNQIFHNLDMTNDMIEEHDEPILNHLLNVRYELIPEPKRGFKLFFEFSENEYFTNKELTKEYYYSDIIDPFEPLQHEGLILVQTVGCKIDWKSADKNVTKRKVQKKMKHKNSNNVKLVDKIETATSFFNFFDPPTVNLQDADDDTKALLVHDFDIAETLRHSVIPRAVIYFTGEGIEDDEEYEDDDFDEDVDNFDDFDEDEEDSDLEDDDDDDGAGEDGDEKVDDKSKSGKDKKSKGKSPGGGKGGNKNKGGKGGGGSASGSSGRNTNKNAPAQTPPECKQQ